MEFETGDFVKWANSPEILIVSKEIYPGVIEVKGMRGEYFFVDKMSCYKLTPSKLLKKLYKGLY